MNYTIYVFGLGAIGSNLLLQLAKKYPNFKFVGIDYDVVEERNLGNQAFLRPHIEMPKAHVMNIVLSLKLQNFNYCGVDKEIKNSNDLKEIVKDVQSTGEFLIIDCFDNSASRKIIVDEFFDCKSLIHIGFSPQYTAEIIWNYQYEVPGDVDPHGADICEVRDAIPFIGFVNNFAALVISDYIEDGVQNNFIITNRYQIKKL